jgi:hypothetical protein
MARFVADNKSFTTPLFLLSNENIAGANFHLLSTVHYTVIFTLELFSKKYVVIAVLVVAIRSGFYL